MARQPSKDRIPCPLCHKSDRVVRRVMRGELSWRCQRCKVQFSDTVSGPLRVGLARAIYTGYGRGPRAELIATLPADVLEEFDALVGEGNVGRGGHRSAVLALALELLLAVLAGKLTWRVANNLATLSVEPGETRENLAALLRHLAEREE